MNKDEQYFSRINSKELADIARRHGFESISEPINTSNNRLKWTNTSVFFNDKFNQSDFNGNFHTHAIDDQHSTFCYLCSINQHEHEHTKPREESQRRKLVPYKNPKARLPSSSKVDRSKSSLASDLIPYRFTVRTGTEENHGTRAQVFLYIYGTENNWTGVHLQKASNNGFPSGSTRTFCLKGPEIGKLHHLNVNLVGNRSDKEWFLKDIEITNLNTSLTWLCAFNCWLPKADQQEEIKPSVSPQREFVLTIYILQIRTGEKSFAGTDSNIQVTIRGSKSQTHRLALTSNRVNLFEQNQLDTFAIIGNDLGDLLEMTVESDRSQLAADWDIKEMIMWKIIPNNDREKDQVYFPFNSWLGKKISTLKSKRETYPTTDQHRKGPICYQIIVKTGRIVNAGTDANVFVIIYGKSARTGIHLLNNQLKNDFERNTISEFTIMDIDVGSIDRIKIWHDNSGPASAWFLDSIIIRKKYSTCSIISNIYVQRLEQISQAFYRQIKKNSDLLQSSMDYDDDDKGFKGRLGSSRSILRSPTMYDRNSLQKKVTWDEQSIGSQDDFVSTNSMTQIKTDSKQKKEELKHSKSGHIEHQAYWISSHSYVDNRWKIKSIEEMNSFDFDQSTRMLLLSDRATINNKIKSSIHDNEDEIYEFQANRWLAKDKEDGKTEAYLTGKLSHKPSSSMPSKHSSLQDLRPIEKSPHLINTSKTSAHDLRSVELSTRPHLTQIQHDNSSRIPSSLEQRSKSPRDIHHRTDSMSNERELLARLTGESSSRSKLPANMHTQESFRHMFNEQSNHSRSKPIPKSARNFDDVPIPITNKRESLTKFPDKPFINARPSPRESSLSNLRSASNQSLKSLRNTKDPLIPLTGEEELLARITNDSSIPSTLTQHIKSPRHSNTLINSSFNENDSLAHLPSESLSRRRLGTSTSLSSSKFNHQSSPVLSKPSIRPKSFIQTNPTLSREKSIYDQAYKSAYNLVSSDDF